MYLLKMDMKISFNTPKHLQTGKLSSTAHCSVMADCDTEV
jgi:hypothetical protein